MTTENYNINKNRFLPYLPFVRGQFAIHKNTDTIILVARETYFLNELHYDCEILSEGNLCNATYHNSELSILPFTLQEFIKKHNLTIGIQLELF